jgi:CheY-like chemotaxis protein
MPFRASGPTGPAPHDDQRTRRILVVDDQASVLAVIVEQIQSAGLPVEIESTTSGREACERFAAFAPDLVILDVRMPEMDGREVFAAMKRSSKGRDVKFLMASAMDERAQSLRELGCDGVIVKPFDLDELVQRVALMLGLDPGRARAA